MCGGSRVCITDQIGDDLYSEFVHKTGVFFLT